MVCENSNGANKTAMVKKRNDLFAELNRRGLSGYAVEIGVAEGGFSFYLLQCWPGTCYQVDTWSALSTDEYNDYNNVEQVEQDRRYTLVLEQGRLFGGRAVAMKMKSEDAVKQFKDEYFDFIYIDANHKYQFIKKDLELWYPKCKVGGIFAGHDYLDGVIKSGEYGVKTAVNEFLGNQFVCNPLNVTEEKDYPTWWWVKDRTWPTVS